MRKLFTLLVAVFFTATGWTQSPEKMSYQAVIRDGTNHLVTTQIGMKISILLGNSPGTPVYVETQTPTPNLNGLVTIDIGSGVIVSGTFAAINWSAGAYYIKTEIATAAPLTTYTITSSNQLLSVPYALYAKTAETAVSGTGSLIHYIGEKFGGGIVVSVWKVTGVEHGLIASLTDVSTNAHWNDVTPVALAGATNPLDGAANTASILIQSSTAPAALVCKNYAVGGFSDWYLPSIWELKECYNAGYIVNTILGATDGFQFAAYWSSTENDATNAWYLLFNTGITGSNAPKTNPGYVRAVRKY
jgi:hypothetical protein